VQQLTPPATGCLHHYQFTPQDLALVSTAQALVVNGSGMEGFLDRIISQYPHLYLIDTSRHLAADSMITVAAAADHAHAAAHHDHAATVNPHFWVSIANARVQVTAIAKGLVDADPAHAAAYTANAAAYDARLAALQARLHAALDTLPQRDIVTFHAAFDYFAREFNLRVLAVIEREPGVEPSPADLAALIRRVRAAGRVPLFVEPQYPPAIAATIARETGSPVHTLDPCVTGPAAPDAYLQTMEQNLAVLTAALQ
jgi:zinc transport system substrate-binding protein